MVLILDELTSPANIGSLFRLADAFNLEKIILCGPSVDLNSNRLRRTARSTIGRVAHEEFESTSLACEKYSAIGFPLIALEITDDSTPINSCRLEQYTRLALIVGNERSGINEEVLKKADARVHIKMFGKNSSMNVAQATGIALYEITRSLPHI